MSTNEWIEYKGTRIMETAPGSGHYMSENSGSIMTLPGDPRCPKCTGSGTTSVLVKVNENDFNRYLADFKSRGIELDSEAPGFDINSFSIFIGRAYHSMGVTCECLEKKLMTTYLTPRIAKAEERPATVPATTNAYVTGDWMPALRAALVEAGRGTKWRILSDAQMVDRRFSGVEDDDGKQQKGRLEMFEKDSLVIIEIGSQGPNARAAIMLHELLAERTKYDHLATWIVGERELRRGDPMWSKDVQRHLAEFQRVGKDSPLKGNKSADNGDDLVAKQQQYRLEDFLDAL